MGTNYYLRKKASYIPREDRSENWWENNDFDFYDNVADNLVNELSNGYVWNNTYYPTIESLNKDYYLLYHIGKDSAGWRFSLAIYTKENITSLNDWKKLFKEKNTSIVNEYNEKISSKEMLKIITKKKPNDSLKNDTSYTSFSGEVLEVRNGLIVHPLKYGCIDNSKEETYDVLDHWDFC